LSGPTPENVKGWLGTILAVTDRATSLTLLFMLVTGGLFGHFALKEMRRIHTVSLSLFDKLQESHKAQLEMALRCDCTPTREDR
jgi:hypothetical protein